MERLFHAHQLVALAFQHLGHRNAGPFGDNLGNLLVRYPVPEQLHLHHLGLAGHIQLAFQLGDLAILELGHLAQITRAAGVFQINPGLLQPALDLLGAMKCRFLGVPDFFQVGVFPLNPGDHIRQLGQAFFGRRIRFLLEGLTLDFELNQASLEAIKRLRLGVHLHPNLGGCLVHQVNGLVRQLPVRDITVRQFRGSNDRAIGDFNPVVNLIAFFQATKDRNGVFLARLAHQYLLETALKRSIFLDVFPVLIQSGGAHTVQFAPGQCRLEHVASIHGAFGLASPDHGMDLVNKQDDLAFLFG